MSSEAEIIYPQIDEIWIKIFSYLSYETILKSASLVCKYWNQVIKSSPKLLENDEILISAEVLEKEDFVEEVRALLNGKKNINEIKLGIPYQWKFEEIIPNLQKAFDAKLYPRVDNFHIFFPVGYMPTKIRLPILKHFVIKAIICSPKFKQTYEFADIKGVAIMTNPLGPYNREFKVLKSMIKTFSNLEELRFLQALNKVPVIRNNRPPIRVVEFNTDDSDNSEDGY